MIYFPFIYLSFHLNRSNIKDLKLITRFQANVTRLRVNHTYSSNKLAIVLIYHD
uniref:Uncharacterized protein n=1 Tax=Arundo donax TaxID=35708 RepID=A0A0A9BNY9_ARUDO